MNKEKSQAELEIEALADIFGSSYYRFAHNAVVFERDLSIMKPKTNTARGRL